MSVNWSHLSPEIISKVCMCYEVANGFKQDPATGWWVHNKCGKPTIPTAVKECDICFKDFVPKFYSKAQNDFLGIMCDECDPPRNPN